MLSIYQLKPAFQGLLRPAVRMLARSGIKANHVTIFACAASILVGWVIIAHIANRAVLLLLPPFLFLRMALNAIDGMLAREFGQQSDLGTYLNELTDVISDVCLYAPFAFLPAFDPRCVSTAIFLAVLSEMAGILGVSVGVGRRYEGPLGKSDRAFFFGALATWLGFGGQMNSWAARLFLFLLVLLLAVTIVNRIKGGLAEKESHRHR